MGVLRKLILVLGVMLISSILWLGTTLYLNYSSTELRGEILGSENVYQFLSRGMLDEVQVTLEDDETMPVEGLTMDILEPIHPTFSTNAFEKIMEKVEDELIVHPDEFHELQNEAVMKSDQEELEQQESQQHDVPIDEGI